MIEFFVRDDVFISHLDECGHGVEALCYYVVAEAPNGRRFAHERTFHDAGVYGVGEALANRLLAAIVKAYVAGIEPQWDKHWQEIDPAYGSDAYQGLDNERYFRNREIMEAHDAGEISEGESSRLMMR